MTDMYDHRACIMPLSHKKTLYSHISLIPHVETIQKIYHTSIANMSKRERERVLVVIIHKWIFFLPAEIYFCVYEETIL